MRERERESEQRESSHLDQQAEKPMRLERGFRQNNTTTEAAAAAAVERGGKKEEFIIDCARALCRITTTSTFNTRAHGGPINITSNFHDVP